ncbi:ABC transporter G family member 11 [Senna tora]|uniref:ABC transporter G family member 11 n=1 Tax=Senna tora TaxID=362788 RepID=A0A834WJF8_9FABA|nr:ABC transporter G family member 11 [Senna tora]
MVQIPMRYVIGMIAPLSLPPPPSEKPLPRKGKLFAAFTRPRLLFLDEPTSGLDSAASYYVMRAIARLGHKDGIQRTIIASIHQPSSDVFQLFHNLCLHSKKLAFSRQWLLRRWRRQRRRWRRQRRRWRRQQQRC